MNLTTAFLWAMIPLMAMALTRILYLWGRRDGINSERIKLYGNTLPRFENPPPPPPKFTIEPDRCQRVGCNKDALWRVEPNDGGPLTHILCCTDHMQERVDRLPGKPYKVTRIEGKEKKGVPTMPNHPPMPDVEKVHRQDLGFAKDYMREHPEAPHEDAYRHGFSLATDMALAAARINKAKESLSAVTQDQLIDALMDMRIENFLCAHTIPAHAGTDLYYLSRKETAEYLLDMYTITPKAKH
jgi:hypothetical protein